MIDRATFLAGALLATGGIDVWEPEAPPSPAAAPSLAPGATIRVAFGGSVQTLDLERYLAGVVPLESPPSWPAAALQAQAIVARTYALTKKNLTRPYDVTASDSDQRYGGPAAEHPATTAAVLATRGRVLAYRGGTVNVFYSACCGGHTADATSMWGRSDLAYLRGVDDGLNCSASPDYQWRRQLPLERAVATLADLGIGTFLGVAIQDVDTSGRPRSLALQARDGRIVSMPVAELRKRWGTELVRSLWLRRIAVETTQAVANVVIEGSGRGHGVGFCQWGARGLALAGSDAEGILAHYFPGTAVIGA